MKMNKTILLLVSVFFCILVTQSCGIPVLVNLTTSEYTLSKMTPTIDSSVAGTLSINVLNENTEALLQDQDTIGPSLMFFYALSGNASEYPIGNIQTGLINAFSTKHINKPYGIAVSDPEEVVSYPSTDPKVYLYGFNDIGKQNFTAPEYILWTDDAVNADLDDFTLTAEKMTDDETAYKIKLSYTQNSSSGTFHSNSTELFSFEGKPFVTSVESINARTSQEYLYTETNPSDVYLNIFCAFYISGHFTNQFWSPLVYLGQIKLPLSS
ncbi:MAG: hypothetical protein PHO09_08955 [Sphaerochaeta sp.]|nr:hypothetical protein [Sphaerochaeta sp.]